MGRAKFKPVIEYCGGTEIGGAFVTGSLLQPQSLAAFSTPAMGHSLIILGDDGNPLVSIIEDCLHISLHYAFLLNHFNKSLKKHRQIEKKMHIRDKV